MKVAFIFKQMGSFAGLLDVPLMHRVLEIPWSSQIPPDGYLVKLG